MSDFKTKVSSSSHWLLDRILCFFVCLSVSIRYELLSALPPVRRNHLSTNRAIFVWPWKMVSVSVRYFFLQPVDEKIKTWTLRFPAKENPNMEKALFDWAILLRYDVKAKYRLIPREFSGMKIFHPSVRTNQPKATRVCNRSTNQSNRSICVRLLFLFCSHVFSSRSYENRSI